MPNQIIGNTEYKSIKDKAYINGTADNIMQLAAELDKSGIGYSGRISEYRSAITVEAADRARTLEIMKGILNSAKETTPAENTEKNIIGNAEYRYIPNKRYVKGETEAMLRTADRLTAENISFSGRIKGDTVTLTVSGDEAQELVKKYFAEEKNRIENIQSAYFLALSSDTFEDGYYISEVNVSTGEEIAPYKSSFGDIPMFLSVDEAVRYSEGAEVVLSNSESQLEQWRREEAEKAAEEERQLNLFRSREIKSKLPMTDEEYDEYFVLRENAVDWIYFNPDGADGEGQFVVTSLYEDDILSAYNARINADENSQSAFVETIENGRQTVINADTEEFERYALSCINSRNKENVIISAPIISGNEYSSEFDKIIDRLENHFDKVRGYKENKSLSEQLVNITDKIIGKQKEITDYVADSDFTSAAAAAQELAELSREAEKIKAKIQEQEITSDDVKTLRSIQPARKSVQNMLKNEVSKTSKFEKLLGDEMGAKSAYEMRNSDNAWRNDESKSVNVIEVSEFALPEQIADLRKSENINKISRGTFTNKDTGIEIIFGRNAVGETVAKAIQDDKRGRSVEARVAALYQMQELVENAVCFDSEISDYDPVTSKNKSPNTLFMHKMYGVMNYKGEPYLADLTIEEMYSRNAVTHNLEATSNKVYSFKDIRITPMKPGLNPRDQMSNDIGSVSLGATITIPQLYSFVKAFDQDFFENPKAAGRSAREAEIEAQNEFSKAMEILAEKENTVEWKPIPESEDEETGKTGSYAAKVDGDFYWITENENHRYDIEYDSGAGIVPISEEYTNISSRSEAEAMFEDYIEELRERKKAQENLSEIDKDLQLKENPITFSVVSIDGGEDIVVGEYIDEESVRYMDEYMNAVSESNSDTVDVQVHFYTIGDFDNESIEANEEQIKYISEHLSEVLPRATLLEREFYNVEITDDEIENSDRIVPEKNLEFTVITFEDDSVYVEAGKIDDDNVNSTATYEDMMKKNFDINKMEDLDESIKVEYAVYHTGDGEAVMPTEEKLTEIRNSLDDYIGDKSPVSTNDSYLHPWKNVDDILYELEELWKERHSTDPQISDSYDSSFYLLPKDLKPAGESKGVLYYDTYSAINQIKLSSSEWLDPFDAAVEMNRRSVDLNDIEMLNVNLVDKFGIFVQRDITPEQFAVFENRIENNTQAYTDILYNYRKEAERREKELVYTEDLLKNNLAEVISHSVASDELEDIQEKIFTDSEEKKIEIAKRYLNSNLVGFSIGNYLTSVRTQVNDDSVLFSLENGFSISYSWSDIAAAYEQAALNDMEWYYTSGNVLKVYKQTLEKETAVGSELDVQLDRAVFTEWVSDIIARQNGVKAAYESNDKAMFEGAVRREVDIYFYMLCDKDESIGGYNLKDISDFVNDFCTKADLRKEIYAAVAENVDISLGVIQKAKEAARNAGLPFREAPFDEDDPEDFNPYVFDGSMSPEDYELMHKLRREDSFEIYQVKSGEEYRDKRFVKLSELNGTPNMSDYDLVYSGKLSELVITAENKDSILESLYAKFNINRPEDFTGRSMSVSDVVVLHKDGEDTAHYVDDMGFKVVQEFLKEKAEPVITSGTIEKYGLDIDFKEISSVVLRTASEEYAGGLDSDGHERRDNYSLSENETELYYSAYFNGGSLVRTETDDPFEAAVTIDEALEEIQNFLDRGKSIVIKYEDGKEEYLDPEKLLSERTKQLINEYVQREFGNDEADFSNTSNVHLGYTTDEETDVPIQVYADLDTFRIIKEYGGKIVDEEIYDSLEDMNFALEYISFDELTSISDEQRSKAILSVQENTKAEKSETQHTVDSVGFGGISEHPKDKFVQPLHNSEKPQEDFVLSTRQIEKDGFYEPRINDIVEKDDNVYKITDIGEKHIKLLEADTLLPSEKTVLIEDFHTKGYSLVERAEVIEDTPGSTENDERIPKSGNFSININDDSFGNAGGVKSRYAANIEAIKTLKRIEAENRTAAAEEQNTLAGYTGWGAIPQAFDPDNGKWKDEYNELKELLTSEEYAAARKSTMNAHYTSPTVISAIYDGLRNIGFEGGKILEPAMGTGNFFGAMPENIQNNSKLYGVELDSITGRIAKQLYPNADIQIKGFEAVSFTDNSFDAAVGNVPFGEYSLNDKRYNDNKFLIHDYFFAKALDKIRPGGIIAFVTSKGTLDKENSDVRKYLAERAELLGAVRLPNNAFKANAGTEVTSDIIFLQKREKPIEIDPYSVEWLKKEKTAEGLSVNNYFVQHPEMVLGKIVEGNKLYGHSANDTSCIPIEGADLKQQLAEAMKNIQGRYAEGIIEAETAHQNVDVIPAPENSRYFSFCVSDGRLYFREAEDTMKRVEGKKDMLDRAVGLTELRDNIHELLNLQLNNAGGSLDGEIAQSRKRLNERYDSFTAAHGNVSDKANAKAMNGDDGYSLVAALEQKDEKGNVTGKADIFFKNTVKPKVIAAHVDTAEEALILSVAEKGRIDFEFMTELCGMEKNKLISELDGQIYRLPQEKEKYVTADEYLTGNIRKKLRELDYAPEGMDVSRHREALEAALPPRVEAKDISVKLGAHWVDPKYIADFIEEKFNPDYKTRCNLEAEYSAIAGTWKIEGISAASKSNYASTSTYGTKRMNAYQIIEGILNNSNLQVKDRVKDEFGNDMRDSSGKYILVVNDEETKAVRHCANLIKSEYADWIFKDPERREALVCKYNETYNSIRHREYDGSHLNFVGMNTDISLKEHQKNAVARALYGGNTLLAHAVGAGKSYEMIAIAMEGKRLGLHNKSLFAVPNALTEQMGNDFRKLYPNANILVATQKDFEKKNRQQLFSKIATNDWDAVIMGHSQFDRMGLSLERQKGYLNEEISKLRTELEIASAEGGKKSFTVKQIEKSVANYEARLEKMNEAQEKEDFIDFEQLGFDKLFVDESHMYKNLATATKMHNVSGLGSGGSAKAFNLLMKTKYLDELTGGRGLTFASGTPVSNSMTELYTLMRYLQSDTLKDLGINHFDEWAADFGEVKTDYEHCL